MRSVRTLSASFLSLAVFFFALPSPGTSQVGMIPDDECRCVDPDGNEIENCRCFQILDRGQFAWSVTGSRPRIGITLSTSGDENAAVGATIQSVMEGGPAERAGLKEGDIITYFDGRSLFDPLEDAEAEADLDLDGSLPAQRLLQMAQDLEPDPQPHRRGREDAGGPFPSTVEGGNGSGSLLGGCHDAVSSFLRRGSCRDSACGSCSPLVYRVTGSPAFAARRSGLSPSGYRCAFPAP